MNKNVVIKFLGVFLLFGLQSFLIAGWQIESVDFVGDVGGDTSIALDTNGYPHISYYDYTNGDLKYAKWTGTSWSIQTVDSAGNVGRYTSIALDTNGYPHISYYGSGIGGLKYAKWTGTSWSTQTVDLNNAYYTSIALDTNGYPHISYYSSTDNSLKYAKWTGTSWSTQTVDSVSYYGRYTSIALDTNNYPHISYWDYTNQDLKYAKWTGTSWSIQTVDSAGDVGSYTSIAVDSNGYPHISYYDSTNGDLKYAKWTGSSWSIQTVDSIGNVGLDTSIAVDKNGNPHISYFDFTNCDLKYAKWTSDPDKRICYIYGYIKDSLGNPIENVTVTLSGDTTKTTTTGSDGLYVFYVGTGTYITVPSKSGWSFDPPARSYYPLNNSAGERQGQDFTGIHWATIYSIKGYVKDTAGKSISGVRITLYGDVFNTYTTNDNGYYEFSGLPGKNYLVTAYKKGWRFSPAVREYSPLDSDKTEQYFVGTQSEIEIPDVGEIELPPKGDIKCLGGSSGRGTINPDKGEPAYILYNGDSPGKFNLRVFTLNSEIVYEDSIETDSAVGYFKWIPKNIASGIYLVHIEGPGIKRFRKLAILR